MAGAIEHGALMDDVYRYQRKIYDVTRKYYLLGRDDLIAEMDVAPGAHVLEVACGTGRNLENLRRHHPQVRLYGLDISAQMLITAQAKLGQRAKLAQADACDFAPERLFGQAQFDHIVLSYCLSMIPDWEGAIAQACRCLAPGGTVHIVDFGACEGLPNLMKTGLYAWLARFHVSPRLGLPAAVAAQPAMAARVWSTHRGYTRRATLRKPVASA